MKFDEILQGEQRPRANLFVVVVEAGNQVCKVGAVEAHHLEVKARRMCE